MSRMKRVLGMLLLAALLCAVLLPGGVMAAEEDEWNTDLKTMPLRNNEGFNYIRGVGMNHSPGESFIFPAGDGVGILQFRSRTEQAAVVAEFDADLGFLRWRRLETPDVLNWCGFYAGENWYYLFYSVDKSTLRVDQYDKGWTLHASNIHTFSNTSSFPHNDFDVCQAGGRLVIVTNHTMSEGDAKGHEANMRIEMDAETLVFGAEQSGVASYNGYVSHSYVPEVAYSDGIIYAFDRCDSFPGSGVYMTTFEGRLSRGKNMRVVGPDYGDWRNWGNIGNAVPAGGGVLVSYNQYPYEENAPYKCNAYLEYVNAQSGRNTLLQLTQDGGVGTPCAVALDETHGFILWNPDLYVPDSSHRRDLYLAPWTVSGGVLTVGAVSGPIGDHILADCEPISWNGSLIWFTTQGSKLLKFHILHADGSLETKDLHEHEWGEPWTRTPQCTEDGCIVHRCAVCREEEIIEVLPAVGHDLEYEEAIPFDCVTGGLNARYYCHRCYKYFEDADGAAERDLEDFRIPAVGEHDWGEGVLISAADCVTETDGITRYTCVVCGKERDDVVEYRTVHQFTHVPALAATCTEDGWREHYHCELCQQDYYNEDGIGHAVPRIPATGHKYREVPYQLPTETEPGWITHYRCERCGGYFIQYAIRQYREVSRDYVMIPPEGGWQDDTLPGDVNGDGCVNNKDAILLFRYLAGREVALSVDEADLNGDGRENMEDVRFLFGKISAGEAGEQDE